MIDHIYKIIINNNELYGIISLYKNNTIHYNLSVNFRNNISKEIKKKAIKLFLSTVKDKQIFADILGTDYTMINILKEMGYIYMIIDNIYRFKVY